MTMGRPILSCIPKITNMNKIKFFQLGAEQVFEILEPALKRHLVNGSWRYETGWGSKTKEGIIATIREVMATSANSVVGMMTLSEDDLPQKEQEFFDEMKRLKEQK